MTSFQRFQELNKARKTVQAEVNSHFLFKGYPSIKITSQATPTVELQAAVVNKQEQEEAYIYTQLDSPLAIGSMWMAKNLHLMITEEITLIKDVNWHKYHAFLCNLEVDGLWGWFRGPEKSHINLTLNRTVALTSEQKPLLVLPGKPLDFQDKIMIKGRAWIIDEYDAISTDGITYYSLMPTTMSKGNHDEQDIWIEPHLEPTYAAPEATELPGGEILVSSGSQIALSTKGGYLKTSNNTIKVLKHTSTEIVFEVPFGLESFAVQTKNEEGNIVETLYKVN